MWWILFTAFDLYIGLVIVDILARSDSIPAEKLPRLKVAKKVMIGALVVTGAVFIAQVGVKYFPR